MAEYIEREALRKILEIWRDAHADVDDEKGCGLLEDVIWEVDAQTAADVAPVVWCKNCKHYREYMGRDMCAKNAQVLDGREVGLCTTGKERFCSDGAKMDGDGT